MTDQKHPPRWLLKQERCTTHQWKQRKRHEFKAVVKALDVFAVGCGFCPGYSEYIQVLKLLETMQAALSRKGWGR